MNQVILAAVTIGLGAGWCVMSAAAPSPAQLDPLMLTAVDERLDWGGWRHDPGGGAEREVDAAALLGAVPGAAVVRNGSLTGIAQLRGLAGDRVKISLDGATVTPACPNHMDPPLHYAALGGGAWLDSYAGVTPVRFGGDSLGGTILVRRPDPEFADDGERLWNARLGTSYRGSHDGVGGHAEGGVANRDFAAEYRGGWARGDDLRIPGGTVRASRYDTRHHDLRAAVRTSGGFLAIDGGLTRTRDTGTPALPMDMLRDDSWRVGLRQKWESEQWTIENRWFYHEIDHLMDNFSLRPAMAAMRMEAPAASRDSGWSGEVARRHGSHTLRAGVDLHRNEFSSEQVMVATGARRDTFADNRRERIGVFAEWENEWTPEWTGLLGMRGDLVRSRAGAVRPGFGPPEVAADAAAFNAADRSHDDLLPDFAAMLRFEPDDDTRIELAAGVKNRAPSLVERYLWTPLNASAGLADGRTYLGNTRLDPETSFQLAASASRRGDRWECRFTPFYNRIRHFIQGRPIARLDTTGRPVLEFQNLRAAELYGAELTAKWRFNEQLSLEGLVSHVRGRDKDDGDNLYRIAPLRGLLDLGWQDAGWEAHLELDWAAKQDKVSAYNQEPPTPGCALVHLRVARSFENGPRLEIGVENIADEHYAHHLGGINRVAGSDVAVGQRIPGAGRFGYATLSWEF